MNVLVTNTRAPQAYAVIRALRPHARRIVAAVEGEGRLATLAHAANSRLVDRRCRTPSPVEDWWHGRVGPDNSPAEAAYVAALLRICEAERIDVVYPSWDPFVYVLSKNKARFEAHGITIPVPDFDVVLTSLDKYRTIRAGEQAGCACPRTILYEPGRPIAETIEALGFPMVLKPRFTSGGRGMAIVRDRTELEAVLPGIVAAHGGPLLQEYIPGGRRDSVQFVLDRQGAVLFVFHKKRQRTFRRTARFGTVSESAEPDARVAALTALARRVGWWGAMGVETIRDPRDGLDKLMEINPRFPRQLWNRTELGINEPLMCIRLARGEPVAPAGEYPRGVLFVSPVEDLQLLGLQLADVVAWHVRTRVLGRAPLDRSTAPLPVIELLRAFARTYRGGRRRVWDPYSRYFLQDPVAALLWWLQFATWLAGSRGQVGR